MSITTMLMKQLEHCLNGFLHLMRSELWPAQERSSAKSALLRREICVVVVRLNPTNRSHLYYTECGGGKFPLASASDCNITMWKNHLQHINLEIRIPLCCTCHAAAFTACDEKSVEAMDYQPQKTQKLNGISETFPPTDHLFISKFYTFFFFVNLEGISEGIQKEVGPKPAALT